MRAGSCDSIGRMSVLCGDFESAVHPVLPCRALERRRGWLLAATVIAPQQVGISIIASITDRITIGRRGFAHARRLPLTTAARRRSQHEGKSWSDLPRTQLSTRSKGGLVVPVGSPSVPRVSMDFKEPNKNLYKNTVRRTPRPHAQGVVRLTPARCLSAVRAPEQDARAFGTSQAAQSAGIARGRAIGVSHADWHGLTPGCPRPV